MLLATEFSEEVSGEGSRVGREKGEGARRIKRAGEGNEIREMRRMEREKIM